MFCAFLLHSLLNDSLAINSQECESNGFCCAQMYDYKLDHFMDIVRGNISVDSIYFYLPVAKWTS